MIIKISKAEDFYGIKDTKEKMLELYKESQSKPVDHSRILNDMQPATQGLLDGQREIKKINNGAEKYAPPEKWESEGINDPRRVKSGEEGFGGNSMSRDQATPFAGDSQSPIDLMPNTVNFGNEDLNYDISSYHKDSLGKDSPTIEGQLGTVPEPGTIPGITNNKKYKSLIEERSDSERLKKNLEYVKKPLVTRK